VVNGPYYYVIPEHLPPALVSSPCTHHVTEVARSKGIETQAVESTRYMEQCVHSNYFLHHQETSVLKCSMREREFLSDTPPSSLFYILVPSCARLNVLLPNEVVCQL